MNRILDYLRFFFSLNTHCVVKVGDKYALKRRLHRFGGYKDLRGHYHWWRGSEHFESCLGTLPELHRCANALGLKVHGFGTKYKRLTASEAGALLALEESKP